MDMLGKNKEDIIDIFRLETKAYAHLKNWTLVPGGERFFPCSCFNLSLMSLGSLPEWVPRLVSPILLDVDALRYFCQCATLS